MEAYLDHAATTKCSRRAAERMLRVLTEDYGNPSSLHGMGVRAEEHIREAGKKIARTLKVGEKEIVFTSGGTESNNLAVFGSAAANRRAGSHVITTAMEHASVDQPMRRLAELGYRVTFLPVDKQGIVCMDALLDALTDDTILVSLLHVNNEIGSIQPIAEIAAQIRKKAKHALFHVDAVQSYGKWNVYPRDLDIDLLSASGHKIHGPKGSGFLYIREKTKVKPMLYGGGQQKGMRPGTENVPAIAGLGEAAEEMHANAAQKAEEMRLLRDYFVGELTKLEGVTINGGTGISASPYIVSASVEGVRSETLLHALEERGVYVSSGSACSSNQPAVSRTLLAIGLAQKLLDQTIRFSFCGGTTKEELEYALLQLREIVPFCRRFVRK